MSRRRRAEKRVILPDPKFKDLVLSKFMNNLMFDGKKSVSEKIVYGAFDEIENKMKRPPLEVFHEALDNIKPSVEVRSRRVGGATYQVPVEVRPQRREALAIRWLIIDSSDRNEFPKPFWMPEYKVEANDGYLCAHVHNNYARMVIQCLRERRAWLSAPSTIFPVVISLGI